MSDYENTYNAVVEETANFSDKAFTAYEKTVLLFTLSVISTFFVIAAWSAILLFLGEVEGGGPLGLLMRILPINHLL